MTRERIYLFDTTLRDGQQTPGIDFSVEDKIAIASLLDQFGMDYVEADIPAPIPRIRSSSSAGAPTRPPSSPSA